MRLAESQQLFTQALFEHGATSQALPLFKGMVQLNQERLALYRGNLAAAWEKSLANAYPVLLQLVGEEFFNALAREYGRVYPSQAGDLNQFGKHFAEFLSEFPHVAEYPYFPDMARLEWALHRAHYAKQGEALSMTRLVQLVPEELDGARLSLQPDYSLFASPWAVVASWEAHQDGADASWPQEMAAANYALVLRSGWRAVPLPLTAAAHAALGVLQEGKSVGMALDAAMQLDAQFNFGMHLQTWLQHGVFAGLQLNNQTE